MLRLLLNDPPVRRDPHRKGDSRKGQAAGEQNRQPVAVGRRCKLINPLNARAISLAVGTTNIGGFLESVEPWILFAELIPKLR